MFGTFRYNKDTESYDHVKLSAANGVEARGYTAMACDSCRARKVRNVDALQPRAPFFLPPAALFPMPEPRRADEGVSMRINQVTDSCR